MQSDSFTALTPLVVSMSNDFQVAIGTNAKLIIRPILHVNEENKIPRMPSDAFTFKYKRCCASDGNGSEDEMFTTT